MRTSKGKVFVYKNLKQTYQIITAEKYSPVVTRNKLHTATALKSEIVPATGGKARRRDMSGCIVQVVPSENATRDEIEVATMRVKRLNVLGLKVLPQVKSDPLPSEHVQRVMDMFDADDRKTDLENLIKFLVAEMNLTPTLKARVEEYVLSKVRMAADVG